MDIERFDFRLPIAQGTLLWRPILGRFGENWRTSHTFIAPGIPQPTKLRGSQW